jgi:secreted Zn-dependent insulinase-like peptidase
MQLDRHFSDSNHSYRCFGTGRKFVFFCLKKTSVRIHIPQTPLTQVHLHLHHMIGSLETLHILPKQDNVDVRSHILKLFRKYYIAKRMKLVVLGRGRVGFISFLALIIHAKHTNTTHTKKKC